MHVAWVLTESGRERHIYAVRDDTFVVIVDESLPVYVPPEDETAPLELVVIADFVPGSELLIVDSQPEDPEFSLVGATLEEAEGSTTLTLHYEHPDEDDLNRVIVIEATGVAWSDIVFEGEDLPEELFPLP